MTARPKDFYENYRQALLKGGASAIDVAREIRDMKFNDALIDGGFCPKCASPITRTKDPRQDGPTEIAGTWFNYRCTNPEPCGWFTDRCEPVGAN